VQNVRLPVCSNGPMVVCALLKRCFGCLGDKQVCHHGRRLGQSVAPVVLYCDDFYVPKFLFRNKVFPNVGELKYLDSHGIEPIPIISVRNFNVSVDI